MTLNFDLGDTIVEVAVDGAQGPRGGQGDRGRDVLDLAWSEAFAGTTGQTVFTTTQAFLPGVVDVLVNGIELLRTAFTTSGTHTVTLNAGLAADSSVVVKAFHTPVDNGRPWLVENYGAVGDGIADDTADINACSLAAGPGATIQFTADKTYLIDPTFNPSFQAYGGAQIMHDGQVWVIPAGTELKAKAVAVGVSSVIHAYQKNGWKIIGGGKITGERDAHTGSTGEFGHGVVAFNCDKFDVLGMEISKCWGDGVTLLPSFTGSAPDGNFCTNFNLAYNHVRDCRRNGISPIAARDGYIGRNQIHDNQATAPGAGIDCEPDSAAHYNARLLIEANTIYNQQVAIEITVGNRDIMVRGNTATGSNAAVLVANGAVNVVVDGNPVLRNTDGGTEGAAVRFIGGDAVACVVTNNGLSGGGLFLIESLAGDEVHVRGNRLNPTNTGCVGFARLLGSAGSFDMNVGTMAANTGAAGVQFLQLSCQFGRNTFSYLGATAVGAAILSGTDMGGDFYASALLKRPNGSSGLSPGVLKALRSINASVGGIANGATQVVSLTGVNCILNTVIPFADGNGEGGAARGAVEAFISNETASGCDINITNRGGASQSVNLRLIISTGA